MSGADDQRGAYDRSDEIRVEKLLAERDRLRAELAETRAARRELAGLRTTGDALVDYTTQLLISLPGVPEVGSPRSLLAAWVDQWRSVRGDTPTQPPAEVWPATPCATCGHKRNHHAPLRGGCAACTSCDRFVPPTAPAVARTDGQPPADEWGIWHPDGSIEEAGGLGENRARMVAHRFGGEVIPPGSLGRILRRLVEARDAAERAGDGPIREGLDEAIEHVHDGLRAAAAPADDPAPATGAHVIRSRGFPEGFVPPSAALESAAPADDTAAPDVQVWQSDDGDWGWACARCDYRSVAWWSDRAVAERAAHEHGRDRCPTAGGSSPASTDDTGCQPPHGPDERCLDCATDDEVLDAVPPWPGTPASTDGDT